MRLEEKIQLLVRNAVKDAYSQYASSLGSVPDSDFAFAGWLVENEEELAKVLLGVQLAGLRGIKVYGP